MEQLVLGIDIGSSKICSIIADISSGSPQIIGVGLQPSKGVKNGFIKSIELASSALKESVSEAKRMAGKDISQAYISLSGACVKSVNNNVVITIPGNNLDNGIGIQEINRIMQTAFYNSKSAIPSNYEVVHILPYSFKLDDREYVDDPFGMSGSRLDVSAHVVAVQKSALDNLKKVVHNAGIEVVGIVLSAYASAIATLSNDEKELGVACIDIGASSCNAMIHQRNSMQYDDFLGVGSGHITNDIAIVLNTPILAAETIKIKYATLNELTPEENESMLEIPTINDDVRPASLSVLWSVVYQRVLEMMQILEQSIEQSGLKNSLGAGIVLTGGGACMNGLRNLAKGVFGELSIRIAEPRELNSSFQVLKTKDVPYSSYSTAIGLILYASGKFTNYELDFNKKLKYNHNNRVPRNHILSDIDKENDLSDLKVKPNNEEVDKIILRKPPKQGWLDKIKDTVSSWF